MTKPTDGFGVWLWILAWGAGILPGCGLAFYRTTRDLPKPVDEATEFNSGNPNGDYFPLNTSDLAELCNRDAATLISNRELWTSQWADHTMVQGTNRPAASFAWASVRLPDGTVCSGRYSTRVSVSPRSYAAAGGMPSGPSARVREFHLIERLRPPPAEQGWVGIVPGDIIISPDPGAPRQFLANFQADQDISFEVSSSKGDVDLRVSRENESLPRQVTDWRGSVDVHVRTAGTYHVVVAERASLEVPLVIHVVWGIARVSGMPWDLPTSSPPPNATGNPDGRKQPGKRGAKHE